MIRDVTITKVERVRYGTLARGDYVGTWSGYAIELPLQTEKWILHTKDGIRGVAPVIVTVDDKGAFSVQITK